ncbi:isochorismatase family protein [Rhizobium sp. LCM 4573]|uniref:isochorismatase family protein n=1 Tax=Rhizobium sp. LCM 4573 TaxID=1848291 RepID=UPI0008D9A11B|nr:isochorismatase family protein [Rhizobium sp. LCM 4573]OHV82286.1 isochorismatase [Rhizobium sp. LCM 4573]
MSSRLPTERAPLIVIDLQTEMFDGVAEPPVHEADALAVRVRGLIDWARRGGRKVAFIRHDGPDGDPLAPGAPGWPVWPALGQGDDEPTFGKSVGDAFSNPDFARWVDDQQAGEVILVGAQSDFCVAATVKGAHARGLKVTVVSDAHSTVDQPTEAAERIIARKNAEFEAAGVNLLSTQAFANSPAK